MNVIEYLKRQHEEVRDLLGRMIAEDDKKESRSLLAQVSKVLRLHMQIEEKMVYPAASRAFEGDEDEEEVVLESYEEHAVATRCLDALEATAPGDKRFVIRAKVLKGILDKHIEEEESELFPELENRLGPSGIEKLSEQVEHKTKPRGAQTTRRPVRARGAKVRGARSRASARRSRTPG
jgi:hemerythrin-like domain-containing protein